MLMVINGDDFFAPLHSPGTCYFVPNICSSLPNLGYADRVTRDPAARSSMFVLGAPFGPWTAHVVQLRPIGVNQGFGQTLEEFDEVEGKHDQLLHRTARRLVVPRAAGLVRPRQCFAHRSHVDA